MTTLRISGNLYRLMQSDLRRSHHFAAERVGFLFVRFSKLPEGIPLLLSAEYIPVPDEDYIDDITVGARINGNAIRSAMQRILDTQQGCFHVHLHGHEGRPRFSGTDKRELKTLIPSFQKVGKASFHGALLLSDDSASAMVLHPDSESFDGQCWITVLGPPPQIK